MSVVKLGKSYQVSLPKKLLQEMDLEIGDYFEVKRRGSNLVLTPKVLVEKQLTRAARGSG